MTTTDLEVDVDRRAGRVLPRARLPRARAHHHRRGARVAARRVRRASRRSAAAGSPTRLFDVARPYGTPTSPTSAQLLFPERRVDGRARHADVAQRSSASPRGCSTCPKPTVESWGHMIFKPPRIGARDAVAPGRGVLGAATSRTTPSARGCRSTTSTSTTAACGSCPARTAARCCRTGTSATIPRCTSSSSSTPIDTSAAVPVPIARRRRQLPPPAHAPLVAARTRPTGTRRAWANEFQTRADRARRAGRSAVGRPRAFQAHDRRARERADDRSAPSNPAVVDPTLDSRGDHVREPRPAHAAPAAPRTAAARARRTGGCTPGERVVLADIEGPGIDPPHLDDVPAGAARAACARCTSRCSTTAPTSRASRCRASTSSGCRTAARSPTHSALTAAQEGRGLQQLRPDAVPRARPRRARRTAPTRATILYYQIDYTLQPELPDDLGCLHVTFRRENPTVMRRDFVIADGLRGPGRFLGCNVGVRVIDPATGTARAR